MELEINGEVYAFKFGFGFVKELNKRYTVNANGMVLKAGIDTVIANLITGEIETLVEVLKVANSTEKPRVSEANIIDYIEIEDIDLLFDKVMDGLKESGFTKRKTVALIEQIENQMK